MSKLVNDLGHCSLHKMGTVRGAATAWCILPVYIIPEYRPWLIKDGYQSISKWIWLNSI